VYITVFKKSLLGRHCVTDIKLQLIVPVWYYARCGRANQNARHEDGGCERYQITLVADQVELEHRFERQCIITIIIINRCKSGSPETLCGLGDHITISEGGCYKVGSLIETLHKCKIRKKMTIPSIVAMFRKN